MKQIFTGTSVTLDQFTPPTTAVREAARARVRHTAKRLAFARKMCCIFLPVTILLVAVLSVFIYHYREEHHRLSHAISSADGTWKMCEFMLMDDNYAKLRDTLTKEQFQEHMMRCEEASHIMNHTHPGIDSIFAALSATAKLARPSYYTDAICQQECRSAVRRAIETIIPWFGVLIGGILVIIFVLLTRVVHPYIEYRRTSQSLRFHDTVERAATAMTKARSDLGELSSRYQQKE